MEEMNKWCGVGRLTKDVELKTTSNQKAFCNFTLAVDRRFKDANGQRQADFINCVAWNQTAEFIQKYFQKGSKIGVCGSIQTRSYDNNNGQKVFVTEVIVEEAEFVESQQRSEAPAPQVEEQPISKEEGGNLPFEI
jgi:single-strand DNA-binding protein